MTKGNKITTLLLVLTLSTFMIGSAQAAPLIPSTTVPVAAATRPAVLWVQQQLISSSCKTGRC
ncbi:MAG: hypothetical protein QOD84_1101 [Acidobacteriaceae bacterium]|jgi:hypothetical protein